MTFSTGFRVMVLLILLLVLSVGTNFMLPELGAQLTAMLGKDLMNILSRPIFHLGNLPVTPVFLLKTLLYLLLLGAIARMARTFVKTRILPRTSMDPGQQYAVARFTGYAVIALGLIVGLQTVGLDLSSLALIGGALGIGIGFGLQSIVADFVAGLILLGERPVKVGDRIEVGQTYGDVIRIRGRATWVRTNENVIIIVPNSEFVNNRVTNWTANDRQVRFELPIGVSYGSDPEQVRGILDEVARRHPDVLSNPAPEVLFLGFGDSSLDFALRVWTVNRVQQPRALKSELYFAVFAAFRQHGVEIPFPQRDLHLKSVHVPIPVAAPKSA